VKDAFSPSARPTAGAPPSNAKLRLELLALAEADRAFIEASVASQRDTQKLWTEHLARTERLKGLIQSAGWPTVSQVGDDGASAAWVVVQHADEDLAFQAVCVPLIEAAARIGEAQLRHMACLTDRALTAARRPQLYGTQGAGVPAAERPLVNARRRAIGLPSLEDYRDGLRNGTAEATCRR